MRKKKPCKNEKMSTLFVVCTATRLALAFSLISVTEKYRQIASLLLMVTGIAFLTLFSFDLRLRAPESSTGTTWWNPIRPVHAILYMAASIFMYSGENRIACAILIFDTIFGLGAKLSIS